MQLVAKKKPAATAVKKEQAHNHRRPSPPLLSCDTLCKHSVLVSPACLSPSTHALQEQAWLVVPPRAGRKKKTEQARPDAASVTFFLSRSPRMAACRPTPREHRHNLHLGLPTTRLYTLTTVLTYSRYIGAYIPLMSPFFHRTTRSSLATISSACLKSPRSFSTRTSRPRQQ